MTVMVPGWAGRKGALEVFAARARGGSEAAFGSRHGTGADSGFRLHLLVSLRSLARRACGGSFWDRYDLNAMHLTRHSPEPDSK
jgi:hypothetical protein